MEIPRPTGLPLHTEKVGEEGGEADRPAATAAVDMSKAGKGGSERCESGEWHSAIHGVSEPTIRRISARVQSAQVKPRTGSDHGDTMVRMVKVKPQRVHHWGWIANPESGLRSSRERSPGLSLAGAGGGFHIAVRVRWERRAATGHRQITKRPEGSLFPTVAV